MTSVDFEKLFIHVDFEEKLYTVNDLHFKTFRDYTDYRLDYLSKAQENYGKFKDVLVKLEQFNELDNNVSENRRIFTFINKAERDRLLIECKKIVSVQRQNLDSFMYFINNIQVLDNLYKKIRN